jgi:hypothetical protein
VTITVHDPSCTDPLCAGCGDYRIVGTDAANALLGVASFTDEDYDAQAERGDG